MHGVTVLPNITSFTATFDTFSKPGIDAAFDKTELETLYILFYNLTELQLPLSSNADENGTLMPQSPPTPYSTLQSLSLEWDLPFEYGSEEENGNALTAPR
ncbi:hypothetical protein C8R45DRAFT_1113371 [Mycena sanguinolenta]|nr:hypothetical protein C8R45DRAFT_1113371 [Mycena sanguinolenta]